jgi:hypothetical protein
VLQRSGGGPMRTLRFCTSRKVSAAKGCAGGPQRLTSAACAHARRLPCGARARGPSHNSLRELRSLRSDTCAESDHEARIRARPRALCSSAPPMRTATHPNTPLRGTVCSLRGRERPLPARLGARRSGRELGSAEQRRACGRARSAPRALTRRSCPSVATEGRAASSAAGRETEQHRAPSAQPRALPAERPGLLAPGLARPNPQRRRVA